MVKMKKRGGRWLVYRRKNQAFICFTLEQALFYKDVLKGGAKQ
jgi:hypothetical protein